MKILISLLTLVNLSNANASLVAIMDSGTDISHKDLAPKAWINRLEKVGSLKDLDNDGLPGDVNGWDFTANSPKVFDDQYNNLITNDVKTFFNDYALFELGKLNQSSPELAWLQIHSKDEDLMNKVNFVGEYIHGTHVAGISALNNAQVKILSLKIIPTVYSAAPVAAPATKSASKKAPEVVAAPPAPPVEAAKTVEEFTAEVVESATQQVDQMVNLHGFLDFHKVDVVNQSFGIGYSDATKFIKEGFLDEVKREATPEELTSVLNAYFSELMKSGPKMFEAAPNTVFAIAAGNDNSNNDLAADYPANIKAENKIVVAATVGYSSLAEFSNYGATKVDVAAPGVAITSTAPTNAYIALSGTSQATPFVTNIIAAMKDANPALGARDLKAIVFGTVDYKTWLKGKVVTGGIVNKARAVKAALLAKTKTVDLAISGARAAVADVAVGTNTLSNKSFRAVNLGFTFKHNRPSLLIQKK